MTILNFINMYGKNGHEELLMSIASKENQLVTTPAYVLLSLNWLVCTQPGTLDLQSLP